MVSTASAQTYTTLYSFSSAAGSSSISFQGTAGNFYGSSSGIGDPIEECGNNSDGCGSIFEMTAGGVLTTLASFTPVDASFPNPGLVQDAEGNLYGTTEFGGAGTECLMDNPCGTVFELTAAGSLTLLYSFGTTATGGAYPAAGLVLGNDANLYGTTSAVPSTVPNMECCGTVFVITPSGTLTTLYYFPQGTNDVYPDTPLVQGTDGNFYGTAVSEEEAGTAFRITPAGVLTTLYTFCASGPPCNDGTIPSALIQATDGNFYGTTQVQGANGEGTVFRLTPAGQLTTLYSFCAQTNCADGANPRAGLVQGTDGNLYGTTNYGGSGAACTVSGGCGAIFELSPVPAGGCASGSNLGDGWCETVLYDFCSRANCADGSSPIAGLLQATDRVFYGTTALKGSNGTGTFFSLSNGLSGSTTSATALGLSPSAVSIGSNETVALTATVVPASGSGTPTGTVAFSNGSTYIGTAPLAAGVGTFNYDASGLTVGTYQITAAYSGDATYAVSASSAETLTVNPEAQGGFQLSASSTSLTIPAGQSASTTLTVMPENGFDSQLSFSCSGLPSGATCSFDPAEVTPSGGAVTATLTIATAASARLRLPGRPTPRWAYALLLPCLGVVFCRLEHSRRRRRRLTVLGMVGVLVLSAGLNSCSSANKSGVSSTQSRITVTATTGGSAAITQSVSLTLTITQ